MSAHWTSGEDAILSALVTARLTDEAIGARLKRTTTAVRSRLALLRGRGQVFPQRASVGRSAKPHRPELDQQIIDLMRGGANYVAVGAAIGRTAKAVSSYVHQLRKRRDDVPKSERRKRIETGMAVSFDEVLRQLWAEGLSGAEIGLRLGVTKNAALGRAHRLGLEARPSPILPAKVVVPSGRHALVARGALPAGHPIAWATLTAGTMLEGTAYPWP